MKAKRSGSNGLRRLPLPNAVSDVSPSPADAAAPTDAQRQPAIPRSKRWRRKLRAILTLGLLTDTAFGLFVPAPASALQPPTEPQVVTVMPPAAPSLFHQNSGAEYLLNDDWQTLANKAGHASAEQLASSVVDLANRHAGRPDLTPGLKRYLIQFVLLGGINLDDAADLVEDFAENPDDPRLGPVVRQIRESTQHFAGQDSSPLTIIDGRVVPREPAG